MDAVLLILSILVAAVSCENNTEAITTEVPKFVPGVFIPADALKSLQEQKTAQKLEDSSEENAATDTDQEKKATDKKMAKKSEEINDINFPDQSYQGYQPNQQMPLNPPMGNQQNYHPNQQQFYQNQPSQPVYGDQQFLQNQPPYNQQPAGLNQQPGYNQPLVYQQPNYQQPRYQQPGYQQPGYQQNGMNMQPYPSNQPAILVGQQQGYQNPQGILTNQQPSYSPQMLATQQPNQQLFVPNGQNMGSPNMYTNIQPNGGQSQGNMYALVPVNGQNTPNLNNNNGYFVPAQQMPTNAVLLNNGK